MSTQYLLPCSCGSSTSVQTAQAGEQIRCTCGAELTVPTLRALRNLPVDTSHVQRPEAVWNPGWALVFLGALIVLGGLGIFVWLGVSGPRIEFDRVHKEIFELGPAASWQQWTMLQGGLPGPYSKETHEILTARRGRKLIFFGGCAAVAIGMALAAGGYLLLQRPRPKNYL